MKLLTCQPMFFNHYQIAYFAQLLQIHPVTMKPPPPQKKKLIGLGHLKKWTWSWLGGPDPWTPRPATPLPALIEGIWRRLVTVYRGNLFLQHRLQNTDSADPRYHVSSCCHQPVYSHCSMYLPVFHSNCQQKQIGSFLLQQFRLLYRNSKSH